MKKYFNPAVLVFLGAFILWATLMQSGMLEVFDRTGLLAFRDSADVSVTVGPDWLPMFMTVISHIGGTPGLLTLSLLTVGLAWKLRGHMAALYFAVSIGGGMLVLTVLKNLFGRARPDLVPHLMHETSLSFPSGHATRSTMVYLIVALFAAHICPDKRRAVYGLAALMAALVGTSRVYLGVHWPSDIIGGWLVALTWYCLWDRLLTGAVRKA